MITREKCGSRRTHNYTHSANACFNSSILFERHTLTHSHAVGVSRECVGIQWMHDGKSEKLPNGRRWAKSRIATKTTDEHKVAFLAKSFLAAQALSQFRSTGVQLMMMNRCEFFPIYRSSVRTVATQVSRRHKWGSLKLFLLRRFHFF